MINIHNGQNYVITRCNIKYIGELGNKVPRKRKRLIANLTILIKASYRHKFHEFPDLNL